MGGENETWNEPRTYHFQTRTAQNEVFQYGRRDGILASGD